MLTKEEISKKLEKMFPSATVQSNGSAPARATELSRQAIENTQTAVGGAWRKVIWQW